MIKPMLDSMQVTPAGGHQVVPGTAPRSSGASATGSQGAAGSQGAVGSQSTPDRASFQSPLRETVPPITNNKTENLENPPITFPGDVNYQENYSKYKSEIHEKCGSDHGKNLDEFVEYLSTKEPTWAPSPSHLQSFGAYISFQFIFL